ncbi:hypothetical protein IP88_04860 [alpha proteobacterium AAP81b]|nr:hypothetical protein IP88_04860 [alpha proteobacterium AAP81b]
MLTNAQATAAVARAIDAGTAQGVAVVAVATDLAGNGFAVQRMDGVAAIHFDVARKKALCAASFAMPTHEFVDAISRDPLAKAVIMNDQTINVLPGGMPLLDGGAPFGAIGVAGGYHLQDRAIAEFAAG